MEELERAVGGGLRGMIVVDNCEHVLDAAADLVATILRHSTSLVVLATSRQPLDVDGERVWPVHPLPVGVAGSGGAVDLFLRRASDAGEVVDPEAYAVVGVICQRLDGLPLAVELAAARMRALGADELLASLTERLDGLGWARRDTPRHQTLRAAVEWSLDRLSPRQRLGFALLSVFCGGFDLRAAETVLLVEGFDRGEAADLMVELVDRSMVEPVPVVVGNVRRYRLLETLRHYGFGLLDKHGGDAARDAHAEHYTDVAVALAALATGPEQGIALEQYELEVANVRAAFERSLAADDIERAGRIAEVGMEFGYNWLDYEAVGWAKAVCEPARERRLPVAISLIAIVAYETYLRGDLSSGLAQIAEAEQLAAEWGLPVPLAVRAIKADLLTLRDPAAAVVAYDELAADARRQGGIGVRRLRDLGGGVDAALQQSPRPRSGSPPRRRDVPSPRPALGARVVAVRAGVGAGRARSDPSPPAARGGRRGRRAGARPVHQLRIQMVRARVEIELAESPAGPIAAAAVSQVFDELARTSDLASRWQIFAMAAYLLVHRPATDVATVVGIFTARNVENNRRQWLEGVARARTELGDDTFEQLVGDGAVLNDHEAIAFLCGRP